MSKVRGTVHISGRVQGVWFRQSTKNIADQYAVTGWVRNNPEGSVEAVFEGDRSAVQKVVDWCQQGPDMARVDDLLITWHEATGEFSEFQVR